MGKAIVNKNTQDIEVIKRENFNEIDDIAKGEIFIYNGEEPSIWVLNKDLEPRMISGGNGGVNEDVMNEIVAINNKIDTQTNALHETDTMIMSEISQYQINGKLIKENPSLDASDVSIGAYEGGYFDGTVNDEDTTQSAILKLENMILANALATAASLNDINKKASQRIETPELDEEGYYLLLRDTLNIFNEPLSEIKFKLSNSSNGINDIYSCDVLFTVGENPIYDIPCEYTSMPFTELEIGVTYLLKLRHNFIEVVRLYKK